MKSVSVIVLPSTSTAPLLINLFASDLLPTSGIWAIVSTKSSAAGDGDGLENLLAKIPGVSRVAASHDNSVEFESAPGQDVRPEVARAVVNHGYDLLELRPIGMSLEEIFLQLTRDEPEPPEMAAESDELPGTNEETEG